MSKKQKEQAELNAEQVQQEAAEIADNIVAEVAEAEVVEQPADELAQKLVAAEDKYLRLYAEFDNFRKRTAQEKQDLAKCAQKDLAEDLLPALDSFVRSEQSFAKEDTKAEDLKKGFALIHKQMEDALAKHGIVKMEAKGQPFDPNYHEAVMQQESTEESHTVLEVMQDGYLIHGKVLRPALVIVAK